MPDDITIGVDKFCPICQVKLITREEKGEIFKICPNDPNHRFKIKIRIILGKEEK